ncbi:MAG TPA: YceI family protein [Acidimicrobiales bacterium]
MRRRRLLLIPLVLVIAVVGGTWVYINVIRGDPPAKLTLDTAADGATSTTAAEGTTNTTGALVTAADVAGTWTVAQDGTQVGYRVPETLFGQKTVAVARTDQVTGSMTIEGTNVTAATFTVDMESVESVPAESRRDGQFQGRIMDVSQFPTSTFQLTQPIALGTLPASGQQIDVKAVGKLTLRGKTRDVTIPLQAELDNGQIKVLGNYTVVFDDWGIPNPTFGPASVGDSGTLEILLVFAKS